MSATAAARTAHVSESKTLLALQSVAPSDDLKFAPDCILDRDYRVHLEYKCRQHRAKLMNRHRIVAFHQHVPAPLADSYYEKFNPEIGGGPPFPRNPPGLLFGSLSF